MPHLVHEHEGGTRSKHAGENGEEPSSEEKLGTPGVARLWLIAMLVRRQRPATRTTNAVRLAVCKLRRTGAVA